MQNRSIRVFVAYIGIVVTNTMEWIYEWIIVMNNLFVYMVVKAISGSESDWLELNEFFLKHYKINFSVATLLLPGLLVSIIHVARLCFILKTCIDQIGFWKTLYHFKSSPLVFVHSALTNLAIYDKCIANAEMKEDEQDIGMCTVVTDGVTTRTSQKEKRSLCPATDSLPNRFDFPPCRKSSPPLSVLRGKLPL